MKVKFHVPTQQYGFLEIEGKSSDLNEMEALYNKYAEVPLEFSEGIFKRVETFTGEEILYDEINHKYTDLDGNVLLSGSVYKKQFDAPFDMENISKAVGKKYDEDPETIKNMWSFNGKTSSMLGDALHHAMEQFFTYREHGTEKEYHLPKHPMLLDAVTSFPLKDEDILPEIMVSDVENSMVGQIDGLLITGKKKAKVIDFKANIKIEEKAESHFLQLSYYAHILINHGWEIEGLELWNYTNKWEQFESPVLDLK